MFITGNSLDNVAGTPEFVGISSPETKTSKLMSLLEKDLKVYNQIWSNNLYGMVGAFRNDQIFICGGIINGALVTNRCQAFHLDIYEWRPQGHLNEQRAFAKSVMLANGTFIVTGGLDVAHSALNSTESLNTNSHSFIKGPDMPEYLARHCAKRINISHVFISGGFKVRALARGMNLH